MCIILLLCFASSVFPNRIYTKKKLQHIFIMSEQKKRFLAFNFNFRAKLPHLSISFLASQRLKQNWIYEIPHTRKVNIFAFLNIRFQSLKKRLLNVCEGGLLIYAYKCEKAGRSGFHLNGFTGHRFTLKSIDFSNNSSVFTDFKFIIKSYI